MSGGIPTESTGTATGTDCGTVCQRSIGPRIEEVPLGGHPDPEGQETSDSDRGMDFYSLMAPSQLHRPAEQTFALHKEVETYPEDEGELEDIFAVGDRPPPGTTGDPRNRPPHRHYNRCSCWPIRWDTRCARSPDSPMPQDSRWAIDRSLIRTGDSVLRHGPVRTTPGSSALAADNSDICRPAVHSRTLHYHLSQRVGTLSPTVVNSGMAITNRETPHRPVPHPHQSVRSSFDPHFIFMHQIVFTLFTTGHGDHLYLSTMYRNMRIICGSGSYGVTGGVFTQR